jgi:hypothetical protein
LNNVFPPLIAPIARWSVWESGVSPQGMPTSPDVGFVEPLLRRRLSALARMTLRVAYDCAQELPTARLVYASRHGELARTTTMLESIAAGQTLSPTLFSMSVLNASSGLFSMLQKNVAPATAISAGCSSFGYGLLEACLQLADDPRQPVLYVYADEPAPHVYGLDERPGSGAHAVGLLLQSTARTRVRCTLSNADCAPSAEVQSRAFLRCIDRGAAEWHDAGKVWSWTRDGQ